MSTLISSGTREAVVADLHVEKPKQWGEIAAGVLALPFVVALAGLLVWLMITSGLKGLLVGAFWLLVLVVPTTHRFRSTVVRRAELVISPQQVEIWHDGALREPVVVPAAQIKRIRLIGDGGYDEDERDELVPYLGEDWQRPNLVLAFRRPLKIGHQRGFWSRYKVWWEPDERVGGFEEVRALGLDVVDPQLAAKAFEAIQSQRALGDAIPAGASEGQRDPKRLQVSAPPLAKAAAIAAVVLMVLGLVGLLAAPDPSETIAVVGGLSLFLALLSALVAVVVNARGRETAALARVQNPVVRERRSLLMRARPVLPVVVIAAALMTSGAARIAVGLGGAVILALWLWWLRRSGASQT